MIDALPLEILECIIDHVSLLEPLGVEDHFTEPIGYHISKTWNDRRSVSDLMKLARTCKRLQSVVYSVAFRNLLCYKPWNKNLKEWTEASQYYWDCEENDFFLAAANKRRIQRVVLGIGFHRIPESALLYIQTLTLGFEMCKGLFSPELPLLISKMSSLQEVTIHIQDNGDFPEIRQTIESILRHKNEIIVHTWWELAAGQTLFSIILEEFVKKCRSWRKLRNETLFLKFTNGVKRIPTSFLEFVKKQKHLKSFCVCLDIYYTNYRVEPRHLANTVDITEIPRYLKDLPNLEEMRMLTPDARISRKCDWAPAPTVEFLALPLGMLKRSHKFEIFDNVSYLELTDHEDYHFMEPPFRKLKTLVLSKFSDKLPEILEHFVSCNPGLTCLSLHKCDLEGVLELHSSLGPLVRLFEKIEKLEIYQTEWAFFKEALAGAKNLRFFHWHPAEELGDTTDYKRKFQWMVNSLKNKELSQDLRKIYFQSENIEDIDDFKNGAEWARNALSASISQTTAKKVVSPAVPFDPVASCEEDYCMFVMDIQALLRAL